MGHTGTAEKRKKTIVLSREWISKPATQRALVIIDLCEGFSYLYCRARNSSLPQAAKREDL
jgi:hypothetical protein